MTTTTFHSSSPGDLLRAAVPACLDSTPRIPAERLHVPPNRRPLLTTRRTAPRPLGISLLAPSFLLALLAATTSPLLAGHATVGTDGFCTHLTLAAAVQAVEAADDGPHTIWIQNPSYSLEDPVTIRESLTLTGGLVSCLDPAPGRGTTEFLVETDGPLLEIVGPATGSPRPLVVVEQIDLSGRGLASSGVDVTGPVDVVLGFGSVERMQEGALSVRADGNGSPAVVVRGPAYFGENHSHTREKGGAVYCQGGSVDLVDLRFDGNTALAGGGLYADDCDVELSAGTSFFSNRAWEGGSIFAVGGSTIRSRPDDVYRFEDSVADEGQFLWAEGSTVEMWNAVVTDHEENYASIVHLTGGSHFEFRGSPEFCESTFYRFCADLQAPFSDPFGSLWVDQSMIFVEDSTARISNARLGRSLGRFSEPAIHAIRSDVILEAVLLTGIDAEIMIRMEGDEARRLQLTHVTVAGTTIRDVPIVVRSTAGSGPRVEILSSILWTPESPSVYRAENGAGAPDVYCLLSATPLAGAHVVVASESPLAQANEGLLRPDSEAIDFCDGSRTGAVASDIDAEMRGSDQPSAPDRLPGATFDLGIDEYFGRSSSLLSDGFESGDLSAWS